MMIHKKILYTVIAIIILFPVSVFATEMARKHIEAVKYYNDGDFLKSVALMESIASTGIVNGKLFYNLGNAYFKAGNTGKAILWYERALKLIPNDPDLKFNFSYAEGFVKDKTEDKTFTVYKILFFWKQLFGRTLIQWAGISLFFLLWLMIIFQMIKGRKLIKIHTGITFILSIILIFTSVYDFYADTYKRKAVILHEKVYVRSGLTSDSTELFILHIGTRVSVDDERKGYVKIRFSDDKIGWINKDGIEII